MNPGDYVRYTAQWLRTEAPRHEAMKLARQVGRVESTSILNPLVEVSWPGTRRANQLIYDQDLEVVQEGGR